MDLSRIFAAALCTWAITSGLGPGVAPGPCIDDLMCDDGDVCTYDECPSGWCYNTPRPYGDVDGNGRPNVFDVFCILDLIAGDPVDPECNVLNADIAPCIRNKVLNVFDAMEVLAAIEGKDLCLSPPEGMVRIPCGQFLMGDHHNEGDSNELPVHAVNLDSFHVDVYEVTNQQYVNALNWAHVQGDLISVVDGVVYKYDSGTDYPYCTTSSAPPGWPHHGEYCRITWDGSTFGVTADKDDHPMIMVSWYGAAAYANWRSVQEGRTPSYDLSTWECDFDANGYRLPTEAEWEYAARGGEHDPYFRYPWGDTADGSKANYRVSGDPYEGTWPPAPETTPVGYYDGNQIPSGSDMVNGYGLYDMAGNVEEWCNDWYDASYYSSSPPDNPRGPATAWGAVRRGGSWGQVGHAELRCAFRAGYLRDTRNVGWGFRLALDLE